MPSRNYKTTLGDWQVLHDNLTPRLPDMPQVAEHHSTLGTILGEARDLQNQQEAAMAQLRDLNQRRREILARGGDEASRLALALRSILGPKNEQLLEFGVKPMPRVRRKSAAKQPSAATAPAEGQLAKPAAA